MEGSVELAERSVDEDVARWVGSQLVHGGVAGAARRAERGSAVGEGGTGKVSTRKGANSPDNEDGSRHDLSVIITGEPAHLAKRLELLDDMRPSLVSIRLDINEKLDRRTSADAQAEEPGPFRAGVARHTLLEIPEELGVGSKGLGKVAGVVGVAVVGLLERLEEGLDVERGKGAGTSESLGLVADVEHLVL